MSATAIVMNIAASHKQHKAEHGMLLDMDQSRPAGLSATTVHKKGKCAPHCKRNRRFEPLITSSACVWTECVHSFHLQPL